MKQINPKASKQFILVMIMTVLLAMGRALLLSGVSFPLWFIPCPYLPILFLLFISHPAGQVRTVYQD